MVMVLVVRQSCRQAPTQVPRVEAMALLTGDPILGDMDTVEAMLVDGHGALRQRLAV